MKLVLTRKTYTTSSTIGDLTVDGRFLCHILEDPVRPTKIKGVTAIPAGTYQIVISWSPRFRRQMPLLENVPGFEGIRIHPGNTPADTQGCLLPGLTKATDRVNASRDAYQELFRLLEAQCAGGRKVPIRIVDAGISPYMKDVAIVTPKAGTAYLVNADPLRIRSEPDPSDLANIIGRLPFGMIVSATGGKAPPEWIEVRGTLDGKKLRGYVSSSFLEAVPKAVPVSETAPPTPEDALSSGLHRVAVPYLNLRSEPAVLTDETIVASLTRDQLVRKIAATAHPLWWQVGAIVHGKPLEGFLNSAYLTPDGQAPVDSPVVPVSGEVTVSEKALQLILEFEGMDQPSRWPGQASGISLGHGYDLGYHTHDDLMGDWGDHLLASHLERLAKAIGKRGSAACKLAPSFRGITVTKAAAGAVFMRCTVPKIRLWALKTFPGILALPADAQGALTSLVYNRGTSMQGDRRREMREIRDTVANLTLPLPERIARTAASLRAMKRIWPKNDPGSGHPGIRRRREAEAALVQSCAIETPPATRSMTRAMAVTTTSVDDSVADFLDLACLLAQLQRQRDFLRSIGKLARDEDRVTRAEMRRNQLNLRHINRAIRALDESIVLHTNCGTGTSDPLPQDPFNSSLRTGLTRIAIRTRRVTANTPQIDPLTGLAHQPSLSPHVTARFRLIDPNEMFLTLDTLMELFGVLFAGWKEPNPSRPRPKRIPTT